MGGGGRQAQVAVLVNFDVDDEPFGVSSQSCPEVAAILL